jgi:hypothetical protein
MYVAPSNFVDPREEEQRREIASQAKQDMSDMQKGILKNYWKASIPKTIQQSTQRL